MEIEVSPFAISIQPQVEILRVENSWGDGGGATHSKGEGLNVLRAYLSLVLGHSGGV